jgi:hypothetical protein
MSCKLKNMTSARDGLSITYTGTWIIDLSTAAGPNSVERHALANGPDRLPPFIGAEYDYVIKGKREQNPRALWRGATFEPVEPDEFTVWMATGRWAPPDEGEHPDDLKEANPLKRRTKYWFEFENVTVPAEDGYCITELTTIGRGGENDTTRGPIVNAAGIEFESPLMKEKRQVIFAQQKNFASELVPLQLIRQYDETLNLGSYRGFPQDHAKFLGVETTTLQEENGIEFVSVTVRILISREPLYRKPVNQGFQFLALRKVPGGPATGTPVRRPALDDSYQLVSEPILLNLRGGRIGDRNDAGGARLVFESELAEEDTTDTIPTSTERGEVIEYRLEDRVSYQGLIW